MHKKMNQEVSAKSSRPYTTLRRQCYVLTDFSIRCINSTTRKLFLPRNKLVKGLLLIMFTEPRIIPYLS